MWQLATGIQSHNRDFDAAGRLVRYRLGAVVRDIAYDAADRISGYSHLDVATAAPSAGATALDQSFAYDELSRLTSISTASASWSIGYDANGNRTGVTLNGAASAYTTAATSNRLTAITNPARSLGYDNAGNTTTDTGSGYTAAYDLAGRMASLTKAGITTTYSYNAMGQRVRKVGSSGPSSTVVFVYGQQGELLGEFDQSGNAIREYVWLGSTPIAMFTPDPANAANPPVIFYVHADHLDTPRVVVDRSNNLRWRWMAEPFGTTAPENNPSGLGNFTQNLRFPGQYADSESGLFYNWFRSLDTTISRYTQPDPIGLAGGDMSLYAYSFNQPTRFTDPNGLNPYGDGRPSPSPGLPGPLDVLIPGTPANQQFANAVINAVRAVFDACTPEKPCPPCKTVSGKVVPTGTIAYRPMDTPSKPEHGIAGPHYNIYKANQNQKNCQCFWQPMGAVTPANLPPGSIPIEPFVN